MIQRGEIDFVDLNPVKGREQMKTSYETLDDYLDALDAIKEKVAEETRGMAAKQVRAYFARGARKLQQATRPRKRSRAGGRRASTTGI